MLRVNQLNNRRLSTYDTTVKQSDGWASKLYASTQYRIFLLLVTFFGSVSFVSTWIEVLSIRIHMFAIKTPKLYFILPVVLSAKVKCFRVNQFIRNSRALAKRSNIVGQTFEICLSSKMFDRLATSKNIACPTRSFGQGLKPGFFRPTIRQNKQQPTNCNS